MKIQKSKKIKRFVAFLLSCVMTATAIPAFELCSFAEESSELKIEQPVLLADEKGITREEWIHDLVTIFDMSVDDESTIQKYFTDTADSKYSKDIDLAANYGVFDIYDTKFNPKEFVTREFAAHTANYCIGYFDDGTSVSLKDKNKIYYEYDSIVSVQKNWFALSDGNFNPNSYMTDTEAKKILDDAKESLNGIKIDENAKNTVTYADSVIQIEDTAKATYYDGTVIISDTKAILTAGDVFVVNINDSARLFKAEKVTKGLNNKLIINTTETKVDDSLKEIDIQGVGTVDYENIEYYNTPQDKSLQVTRNNTNNLPNSVEYLASKSNDFVPVNISTTVDGVTVSLTGSINNIQPKYDLKHNGKEVESFYLNATADAVLKGSVSGKINKEIKIAKVPIVTNIQTLGVLAIDLTISANVSVSGEISISYSWGVSGGISYTKGNGWRITKSFQKKGFDMTAKVDESLALKASLSASLLGGALGKGSIYLMGGEKGSVYAKNQKNGTVCSTLKAHLFAEVGANFSVIGIDAFNKSYAFINESNSPLKLYKHWENGKEVSKCSFEDDGTSSNLKPSKSLSPVKYSEYGTYFDGLISYENSADYVSSQTWNENVMLENNVTINGDLNIDSCLNLNGYTLTVTGNFIIGENGYLIMKEKDSALNIGGDFTTKSSTICNSFHGGYNALNSGRITISGNLYQANAAVNNFHSYGTTIKFVGKGTHIISSLNSDTDITDFYGEDGILFDFKGKFHTISLAEDTIISNIEKFVTLNLNAYKLTVNGDFSHEGMINMELGTVDGGELNINGSFDSDGLVSVKGGKINVSGNYVNSSGDLSIDADSVINVEGDFSTDTSLNLNGTINVTGNFTISESGYLIMKDKNSALNIGGDFTTKSSTICNSFYGGYNALNSGRITISGNLYQANAAVNNFHSYGTTIKFVGKGTHIISSLNSDTDINNFYGENGVSFDFKGKFNNISLAEDTIISNIEKFITLNLNAYKLTVNGNFSHEGTINMELGTVDGGELNINGDFNSDGRVSVTGGKINVSGNYINSSGDLSIDADSVINVEGDFSTDTSLNLNGTINVTGNFTIGESGYLIMKDKNSALNIGGDFTTKSSTICNSFHGGYNALNSGKITINGNLYQANAAVNNFHLYGTELKFVGNDIHEFSALNSNTYIDNITLSKGAIVKFIGGFNGIDDVEKYVTVFEDAEIAVADGCTIKPLKDGKTSVILKTSAISNDEKTKFDLTVENINAKPSEILGDVNDDNKVTVADIVALQKFITNKKKSIINTADINKDGKVDVFDVVLLRRMILKAA